MDKAYGYLGPQGTYSEDALALYLGQTTAESVPYASIEQVIGAVNNGEVKFGLVPLENSIEGTVNIALDLIAGNSSLKIIGEVVLPVRQNLMVKRGTRVEDISLIVSHPHAIAQCRKYLNKQFPGVSVCEVNSTGEAARMAAEKAGLAAIANLGAARHNGLDILANDIHECRENSTRFVCISTEHPAEVQGPAKTSVVISITDRPGGLYQILREFALININLTKIESRPAKSTLGDYLFFIDFLGHKDDPEVKTCLASIKDLAASLRVLGSYPCWGPVNEGDRLKSKGSSVNELRQEIDIIDAQLVDLLARRTQLVSVIGQLKKGTGFIRDLERESDVLNRVRAAADKKGVDSYLMEKVFSLLFDHFVELQARQQKSG